MNIFIQMARRREATIKVVDDYVEALTKEVIEEQVKDSNGGGDNE